MNEAELLDIIKVGETGRVQFKQEMDDDKLTVEIG